MPYNIETNSILPANDLDTVAGRSAWLEIDVGAISNNVRAMQTVVGPDVAVMALVKSNGYGHGLIPAARAMVQGGAAMLGVATVGEGLQLRAAGIPIPILVLGYTPNAAVSAALQNDLTLTIGSLDSARAVSQLALAHGLQANLHLKIDTGMHRLGLLPNEVPHFLQQAANLPALNWQAIYTHFATADELDRPDVEYQLQRFAAVLDQAKSMGWHFPIVHTANSAAALWHPNARFDMVRAGLALYGVTPGPLPLPEGFRPAMAFRTRIVRIVDLPPGSPVSYGGIYTTTGDQRIATIPVGYADGFRRGPAWREVLVRGQRAPVVGRICMDYAMIDVTHIPDVHLGDGVTLLGKQGDAYLGAAEVGSWVETSAYEIVTTVLPLGQRRIVGFQNDYLS